MTDSPFALLAELGFSEYEGRAYVALLQHGALSGYEVAKHSGVPRPNVYGVLQRLEEHGAIVRADSEQGVRYAAVPAGELLARLRTRLDGALASAQRSLEALEAPVAWEYVANATGYDSLLSHAQTLVAEAREQLLLAVWPAEAAALAGAVTAAADRGVQITTLCMSGCVEECGGCRGQIFRYPVAPDLERRWLVAVPDAQEVLAGEVTRSGEALAVRTRQRLLVELASWYIRQSITLAAMLADLGSDLDHLMSADTRQALQALRRRADGRGWLDHLMGIVRRSGGP